MHSNEDNKFKTSFSSDVLVRQLQTEENNQAKQKKLKKKHKIAESENVIVVERSFSLVNFALTIFKVILNIVITILVSVGLIALLYDNIRTELLAVIHDAVKYF